MIELADIICKKMTDPLVIGPCSSDNEEAVLNMLHRLSALQKKAAVDKIFMVMCVYTAKLKLTETAIKVWFTNQRPSMFQAH